MRDDEGIWKVSNFRTFLLKQPAVGGTILLLTWRGSHEHGRAATNHNELDDSQSTDWYHHWLGSTRDACYHSLRFSAYPRRRASHNRLSHRRFRRWNISMGRQRYYRTARHHRHHLTPS